MRDDRLDAIGDPRGSDADEEIGRAAMVARMFGRRPTPRVGRFSLLRRVGEGAMGSVWAAYDEDLDRRVAVKLLHRHRCDDERLVVEARRLASVTHPNVVVVYEVGAGADRVFIAMEFVDGPTLRGWVEYGEHSWSATMEMYLQAARGLAAAHDAGVVHRDFKPDNALVGQDRRVRVADFGLASEGAMSLDPGDTRSTDTFTRRRGGTPAYMAPEQLRGEPSDARADQFAWCVSLFEALAGERPFRGTDRDAPLMERLPSAVPAWVRSTLARGLAGDKGDRFASMHDLVAALDSSSDRLRRRRWVLGGFVTAAVGIAAFASAAQQSKEACPDARHQLGGVWDDEQRAAIRDALTVAAPSYAGAILGPIETRLDTYADEWVEGHRDACEATHVRREQSGALLDARVRCLAARRAAFGATVQALRAADRDVAEKAVATVEALPSIAACSDLDRVQALHPQPADAKTAAAAAEELERLARSRALIVAGRLDEGLELVQASANRATELEFLPLIARAEGLLGLAAERAGDVEAARVHLQAAYRQGRRAGQADVAADAASALAFVLARYSQQPEEAKPWARLAKLEGELLGRVDLQAAGANALGVAFARTDELAEADASFRDAVALQATLGESGTLLSYRTNRARAARHAGRLEDAADAAASNLEAAEALLGPQHPGLIPHIDLLTEMLVVLNEAARARELLERGVAIARPAYGAQHPTTARLLSVLGNALLAEGKLSEARTVLEEAVSITEAAGAESIGLGVQGLMQLGTVYIQQGEVELGLETQRRSVAEAERVHGPKSRDACVSRGMLARAFLDADRPKDALPLADATVEGLEQLRGPTHVDVAEALWVRARAQSELDQLEAAATDLERAIAIVDAGFRPGAPQRGEGRVRLAELRLRQRRPADALVLGEEVLDTIEGLPEHQRAAVMFIVARALAASSGDRGRARELAGAALTAFRDFPTTQEQAKEVEAWISAKL